MEQHINSFEKGMNTDLSKTVYNKSQYLRADNLRLVTERGNSELSLETIKGNFVNRSIPRTSSVIKITIDPTNLAWFQPQTLELSRPALNALVFTYTWTVNNLQNYSVAEIHTLLRDLINDNPQDGYQAATNGEYVIIWNSDTNGTDITVGGSLSFNFPADITIQTIVPALSNLKIIGRGYIRDTIVLFTTSTNNIADEPEMLGSDGQIWTLDYNPINPVQSTLVLRYNNILNFTTAHPIPSVDGSVGRAENDFIRRIYWTDNFNRPRQLNTVGPDVMANAPASLELKSPARFTEVVLQNILQNGNVLTGLHNFAYRLVKSNGEASVYSPVSKTVHVVGFNEETTAYAGYRESTPNSGSGKSLQYRIRNLDTTFDTLEVVDIFRQSPDTLPVITRFLAEPIPANGTFDFTYTGNEENVIDITFPEFEFSSVRFKTVKSFADKSNKLFLSNVKIDKFSIEFDARAYRWKNDQAAGYNPNTTDLIDSAGNSITVNRLGDPNWDVPETHDAINPDQSPTSANSYLWQFNGQTIGGSGPNVSYTFTTSSSAEFNDMHLDSANSQGGPGNGYVRNGTTPYVYDIGQEEVYRNGVAFRNHHSPYISGTLRGYQRDEVYRFGLVLYSLDGVPSDVKWIADIRMPHVYMFDMNPSAPFYTERTRQFPIYTGSAGVCFGYNLGVKFDVNVTSIANQISGWSIVRVKRDQEDRTVLGQGMFHPAWSHWNDFVGGSFLDTRLLPHYEFDDFNPSIYYSPANDFATMQSPEFLFANFPGFRSGDTVDFVDVLNFRVGNVARIWNILMDSTPTNLPSGVIPSRFITYWDTSDPVRNGTAANPSALFSAPLQLEDFTQTVDNWFSNPNPLVHVPAGNIVNVGPNTGPGNPGQLSMGGRTLLLRLVGGSPNDLVNQSFWTDDGITAAQGNKYLVNYRRNVPLQYGGNSFTQRSNNEYLYCGQFQPTNDNSTTFTNVTVFGGDTFVCMFDNIKRFKNWLGIPTYGINNVDAEDDGVHQCHAFPCETVHNVDLRGPSATTPLVNNKSFVQNTGAGIDLFEEFVLNPLWSMNDNIETFFPKPTGALDVEVFDHRTYGSQTKIDGELQDSWTIFNVNDYLDVEGRYGPINSTCVLNDRFYFLQDRALGLHSVNERVLTQDLTGATLELGTGQVLQRFDYISTEVGTKHQWSVLPDSSGLYFYASTLDRIYVLTGDGLIPLSAVKGLQSHLNNNYGILIDSDNPILGQGILTGKNPRYNEILFTFLSRGESGPFIEETLCYNNKIEQFTNFYGFAPKLYINFNNHMFTVPPNTGIQDILWWHDVGLYNSFYGTTKPSTLKLLINPNVLETKTFDNFSYHSEVTNFGGGDIPTDTFNTLRSTTNFQDTGTITLINGINIKRKERTWQLGAGRNNTPEQERLRDKFLIAELTYNNLSNRKMILHYFNTFYRKSYR